MRQQLLNKPSIPSTRFSLGDTSSKSDRRRRRERATLNRSFRRANQKAQAVRPQSGVALTPARGFMLSLMFLAPMASLGTLCFALVQNNLRLHEKNDKLTGIANEVKAEIDTLSEEIEVLQQRAGVLEESSAEEEESSLLEENPSEENVLEENAAFGSSASSSVTSRDARLPKGGIAKEVDALDLLEDARAQVPKLNKALESTAEPLKATLAAEAAYPDGLPVTGHLDISSEFGIRGNPFSGGGYEMHEGMDFIGNIGDIVAATGEGTITLAGPNGGYGNSVTIDHGYGYETLYAHLSEVKVKVGDRVKRGQIVGFLGNTGRSSGPHLHYSVYKDKKAIDPRKVMDMPENTLAMGPR